MFCILLALSHNVPWTCPHITLCRPSLFFGWIMLHSMCVYHSLSVPWSEVAQSCLTLCDPMDCSLLRSSVHGIFQARVLEWVAISFSRGSNPGLPLYHLSHQGSPVFPTEDIWLIFWLLVMATMLSQIPKYLSIYIHQSVSAGWIPRNSVTDTGIHTFYILIEIALPKELYQYLFLPTNLAELPHPLPYSSPNYFWDENDIPVFFSVNFLMTRHYSWKLP